MEGKIKQKNLSNNHILLLQHRNLTIFFHQTFQQIHESVCLQQRTQFERFYLSVDTKMVIGLYYTILFSFGKVVKS